MPTEGDSEINSLTFTRRTVIASAALVPVTAIRSAAQPAQSVFSAEQRRLVDAIAGRLVPTDELGPGAAECGVSEFIDRLLAGDLAQEKTAFLEGLAAIDEYARRAQGAPFADLAAEKRDQVISAMENGSAEGLANAGALFVRMRQLTLWGMFSDPYYGGNRNFAGWDLIRYPGPRIAVGAEDQRVNVSPQPYRRSAYGTQSSR